MLGKLQRKNGQKYYFITNNNKKLWVVKWKHWLRKRNEKFNVLTHLKLVNLKNASMLNFEKHRRKITQVEKEKLVEGNKEYQMNLKQLHAQLETTHEQRKSLDPISVKKRLEDYEQMLQYYTMMRTNNKMKDYDVESQECGMLQRSILQRSWRRIWLSIELIKEP